MSQNLVNLFGATGAARYLQLADAPVRRTIVSCVAMNNLEGDGSQVLLDLSGKDFFVKASSTQNDQTEAQQASFTFANKDGQFDKHGFGQYANLLVEDRKIVYQKGLQDPATGTNYLLPVGVYKITVASAAGYNRDAVPLIQVTCLDLLMDGMKQKATSDFFANWQANQIAMTLAERYLKFTPSMFNLAALNYVYAQAQFTDMLVGDMLKKLFEPVLYFVRMGEDGRLTSGPRLGSSSAGLLNIKGFSDATAPPDPAVVSYTFPDAPTVISAAGKWNNLDATNQVVVMGKDRSAIISLGPAQILAMKADSTIDMKTKIVDDVYFSEHSASANDLLAKNVQVVLAYSTDHNLDTTPKYMVYSTVAGQGLPAGIPNLPALPPDTPNTLTPANPPDIKNSDPHSVGFVEIKSVSPNRVQIRIEGRQFSSSGGGINVSHHGGFDYKYWVVGAPLISTNQTLTSIQDYNVQTVAKEQAVAIFSGIGDYQTYQLSRSVLAKSVPVTVYVDKHDGAGPVSLGTNALDQSAFVNTFQIDPERGRIVIASLVYRQFSEDDAGSRVFSTGGTAQSNAITWNQSALAVETPQAVYQSNRFGEQTYTFAGLTVGSGYTLRLHFADDTSTGENQRLFSVFANGSEVLPGFDIYKAAGDTYRAAVQQTVEGVQPDFNGNLKLQLTQYDPSNPSNKLADCQVGGNLAGVPIISGIEILLPQGASQFAYAVNCGGPLLAPPAPTVTVDYGYSTAQLRNGIQTLTINNPLIPNVAACAQVGQFFLNYAAWARNTTPLTTASVGHLQAGDIVRFWHPVHNADFWIYIQQIDREVGRDDGTGGLGDTDTYQTFLLYRRKRGA